jgi:endonuclease/exonuclease/phosphatase family metal-dependent hydrolase
MPSLASFNANNLFLRYKFSEAYPGDKSNKSKKEAADAMQWGFLPQISKGKFSSKNYVFWDDGRRKATAQALKGGDGKLPDILCFQEVESMAALRKFNDDHLGGHYKHFMLVDGLDMRQIDVAIASVWPITSARSNVDVFKKTERVFSRDCLEAVIELPGGDDLTLFINHFKSKLVTTKDKVKGTAEAHRKRKMQSETVLDIIKERMKGKLSTALYAVVGDFNDTPTSPSVAALTKSKLLTDVFAAHLPAEERYTHYWNGPNTVSQMDYVLASEALAKRVTAVAKANKKRAPHIERSGLGFKLTTKGEIKPIKFKQFEEDSTYSEDINGKTPEPLLVPFDFPRLPSVQKDPKQPVSDHAPLKIWF